MWYYRVRDGEVLGAGHSSPQDDEWIARYSAAVGVDAVTIEAFESDDDPRPVRSRTEPPEDSKAVPTPIEQIKEALLAEPALSMRTKAAIAAIGGSEVAVALADVKVSTL